MLFLTFPKNVQCEKQNFAVDCIFRFYRRERSTVQYSTLTRNETVKTHNVRRQTNNQKINKIMIVCAF